MKRIIKYFVFLILIFFSINSVKAYEFPEVSSNNIIFISLDDGQVIYEKNSNERVAIASLTKIMTAIVSIENINNYDEKIMITSNMLDNIDYDFSIVGFKQGDVVTYNDLLYGTLLKSGADATNILAISLCGSIENFVSLMNQKAKDLGMNDSKFSNTIGVDIGINYSSAKDISTLLKYAFKNEKFKEVYTSETYISSNSKYNMNGPLKLLHNDDFDMDYVLGAKTGSTKKAGLCLASISEYDGRKYLLVTIGASNENMFHHFEDSKEIYNYFFNNYSYTKILSKNDLLIDLKTVYGERYKIKSKEDIYYYLDKSTNKDDLIYKYDGVVKLDKNIKLNDKIGTYYIMDNDKIIYQKNIYSPVDVHITLKYLFNNKIIFCFTITLVVILLYCIKIKKVVKNKHR